MSKMNKEKNSIELKILSKNFTYYLKEMKRKLSLLITISRNTNIILLDPELFITI